MKAWDHELKCIEPFFKHVANGWKRFEIRKDDRPGGFQPGQYLLLRETGKTDGYTGRWAFVEITYKTDYEQKPGFCVLGIDLRDTGLNAGLPTHLKIPQPR